MNIYCKTLSVQPRRNHLLMTHPLLLIGSGVVIVLKSDGGGVGSGEVIVLGVV